MNTLNDLPMRAQTLAGQIKQADADVLESDGVVTRARKALESAEQIKDKNVARALGLRAERDAMRDDAVRLLSAVGEPALVAGEGVSKSADTESVASSVQTPAALSAVCACMRPNLVYRGIHDDYVCNNCDGLVSRESVEDSQRARA